MEEKMKILMGLTSHDQLGHTGQNPASSEATAKAVLAKL